jgi:hypothetical protein
MRLSVRSPKTRRLATAERGPRVERGLVRGLGVPQSGQAVSQASSRLVSMFNCREGR